MTVLDGLRVAARDLLRAVADGDPLALRMATDLAASILSLDANEAEATPSVAARRAGRGRK